MSKISSGQLFTLLLVSSAFSFMCGRGSYSLDVILGTAIGTCIQLLLVIPMLLLYEKHAFSFSQYAASRKAVPLLFALYGVLMGSSALVQLWDAAGSLHLPVSTPMLSAALIAAVCLYTSSLGIKALARSSAVVFGILLVTLVVLLVGAYSNFQLQFVTRSEEHTLLKSTLHAAANMDLLPMLFLLLDVAGKRRIAGTVGYLTGSFLLTALLMFLGMGVLGPLMQQAEFPFFMMTTVSQPLRTQRSDALYILVFVMLCVIRITLFAAMSAHLLGFSFQKLQGRSTICLGAMLLLAALAAWLHPWNSVWYLLLPLALVLAVPIWFLLHPAKPVRGGVR